MGIQTFKLLIMEMILCLLLDYSCCAQADNNALHVATLIVNHTTSNNMQIHSLVYYCMLNKDPHNMIIWYQTPVHSKYLKCTDDLAFTWAYCFKIYNEWRWRSRRPTQPLWNRKSVHWHQSKPDRLKQENKANSRQWIMLF